MSDSFIIFRTMSSSFLSYDVITHVITRSADVVVWMIYSLYFIIAISAAAGISCGKVWFADPRGRAICGVAEKQWDWFSFNHEFLLILQIKVIPFKIVPLGSYTATEALFSLFVAVLEGLCWYSYTFHLVGYALLDIIQSTKIAAFQMIFEPGE